MVAAAVFRFIRVVFAGGGGAAGFAGVAAVPDEHVPGVGPLVAGEEGHEAAFDLGGV